MQFYMLIHALCNLNILMLYRCFISHSNEKPIRLQHPALTSIYDTEDGVTRVEFTVQFNDH